MDTRVGKVTRQTRKNASWQQEQHERAKKHFSTLAKALDVVCEGKDGVMSALVTSMSVFYEMNPRTAVKNLERLAAGVEAIPMTGIGGCACSAEKMEKANHVSSHLRKKAKLNNPHSLRTIKKLKHDEDAARNDLLHPAKTIPIAMTPAGRISDDTIQALSGKWFEGGGGNAEMLVERAALFSLHVCQISPRNNTSTAITVRDVRSASKRKGIFGPELKGDGGVCVLRGHVVASQESKSANHHQRPGERVPQSRELVTGEGVVILSGLELSYAICLLILKARGGPNADALSGKERLFHFSDESNANSTRQKTTTKRLQAHAKRWGNFEGLKLAILPDVTGLRSASESAFHKSFATAHFGTLLDGGLAKPEALMTILASRFGHSLPVSERFYVANNFHGAGEVERREVIFFFFFFFFFLNREVLFFFFFCCRFLRFVPIFLTPNPTQLCTLSCHRHTCCAVASSRSCFFQGSGEACRVVGTGIVTKE